MKKTNKLRNRLLAPPVYLAALILLFEDWLWDLGVRLVAFVAAWPPLCALETRIAALRPYPALCVFALPALLLFPVKVVALVAIAYGHPFSGVALIVAAKLCGAALAARLYFLTRPSLLSLAWFARWHDKFIALKNRWIGALRASQAYRHARELGAMARAVLDRLRPKTPPGGRHDARPARMLRRFVALWRARRS